MKKIFITLPLILFTLSSLFSQTWEGDVSSDWNNASNWSGNTLPSNGDDVTIDAGSYTNAPIMTSSSLFDPRDVFINNSGVLTVTGGTLSMDDIIADNGTFTISGGTLDVDRIAGSNNSNINLSGGAVTTTGVLDANSGTTFTIATTVTQTGANDEDIDIGLNATFIVLAGADISGYDDVDFDGDSGTLTMTGGTLSIDDDFKFQDGDDNTVNISGGTLNVGDDFEIETDNNQITFNGTADINVNGQFEFGANGGGSGNDATNSNVTVGGNATLDVTGDINFYEGGSGSSSFLNVEGSGAVTTNNVDDTGSVNTSEGGTIDNGGTVLPVELLFFSGELTKEVVILTWSTASELNNDYFEILHSKNGTDFFPIGRIKGAGTTSELAEYRFLDYNASGINYYQLHQVDYDGKDEFFNIIRIEGQLTDNLMVYPNPVPRNGIFSLQGDVLFSQGSVVKVFSMAGREVLSKTVQNPNRQIELYSSQLEPGNYIVTVTSQNQVATKQIVVK